MSSRRIGNYQITDYVGSGGFGSVFKAEDVTTPGRVVAIKELHKKHSRNQVIKQRFFQEAVAMARLDHPNLPRLYTFGEDNGSYFLVMEFISGKLLSDEIHENGSVRPEHAVNVLVQALDAVSYAHKNGIIHRDLKPDNIILIGSGPSVRIKVLDFGIARMIGGESLTLAGEGFGTPTYMAPERMAGAAGDDPRMDLYAAGIILYEMLTGKAPFESKATDPAAYWVEMRDMHQREPLPALRPLGVPEDVEQIALRATAKQLEDRYQSADEMLQDLRHVTPVRTDDAPTVVLTTSKLMLSTAPGGAEVYVDDNLHGASDAVTGKLLIGGLTAGLHTVRVLKEGFNEYRISVSLEEGRQTDLQVAIPARPTIAMPQPEGTAAGGLDTLKLHGADELKTAVLVVESLPVGTKLFVGSDAVALAGEDGRATVSLKPGAHQIRVTTPTGATMSRMVSVTAQETGSLKTMTIPMTSETVASTPAARATSSGRGKQAAAAAVVVLLLALAAAAFFVLRGPNRPQVEPPSVAPAATATPPAPTPAQTATPPATAPNETAKPKPAETPSDNPQTAEEKKKAAEARRQTEQEAAAIEAQKKAAEAKDKNKNASTITSVTAPQPTPPAAQPQPPSTAVTSPPAQSGDGCILVTVLDADGEPMPGVRVGLMDESAPRERATGRTGPKGRWQHCGLPIGRSVRVAAFGPMGGPKDPQTVVVSSPKNFITIRLQRSLDDSPDRRSDRKGPFRRRP